MVVTSYGEPEIKVDNIEVAQFVYLLLHNERFATSSTPSERKACSCWALHVTRSRASTPRSAPPCPGGDRSVGLLSGFEESAKGFEFGDAS